ncbi:EH domain-containing protein 2 [Linum perenne]
MLVYSCNSQVSLSSVTSIVDGLKKLYLQKLKPLEVAYRFNDFVSPLLTNSDFDCKPMVMLLGQYSTGKTTFIKHLLKTGYPDERSIPGNTVAVQADMPFSGLTTFGTAFLSKFECSQMPHPLMRVYGALMWSLGKVLNTPEVMRVYIGSFNDKPVNENAVGPLGRELFEKEQSDLLADLKDIPKKACDRRINEFVKRARAAKIHAYIISHLKKEMPAMMVQREFHLPPGDFPNVEQFKEVLSGYNIDKFEKLKPKMIQAVDDMLGYDIPDLLKNFRNPYD